uniref:Uncharacterized protein n=2 Tax=Physcomitrium patens TaxID=3218 RepID=A0A7I4DEJ3_PHYPA
MPKPISIYCDDERSIKIATNPNINLRTKYIVTYYHFIKERIEIEETRLIYMPSLEQDFEAILELSRHEGNQWKNLASMKLSIKDPQQALIQWLLSIQNPLPPLEFPLQF